MSEDVSVAIDVLGNAGAAEAKDGKAIFPCAHGSDASVLAMLLFAPVRDVHEGDDERLGSRGNESVGDEAITEVVTGGDGDRAPGRLPDLLVARREAVVEELDGH